MSDHENAPAAPAGDIVQTLYGDQWASYGPRVERWSGADDVEVASPAEGETPQFWSVFAFDPEHRWWWVADVADEAKARMVAAALLLNINPSWPR